MDFAPAEARDDEPFGIDFVNDLGRLLPGEQLASAEFQIGVISGVDLNPAAHLGTQYVAVNPFSGTGNVTMAVVQLSGLVANVCYWLQATATTTFGNVLTLWGKVPPEDPPGIWNP
jgi:hypothetical protein